MVYFFDCYHCFLTLERVASFQGRSVLHELCIVCLRLAYLHEEQRWLWVLSALEKRQVMKIL